MSRSHRSGGSSGGSSRSSSSFGGSSRSHLRSSHSSSRISHHDSHPHSHRSGGIHIHTHSGYGHIHNINISPFAGKCFSFIFILITLSIFLFAMISGSASFKDDLYDIEQSYNKYQNLITYSETHSSYQTTAIIDNILYDYDYDKYYIVYTFSNPSGYPSLTHESFAMYSSVEAMNLHKGDEIIVALDTPKNDISHNTDSINIDYKNVSLEDDVEYSDIKESYGTVRIFIISIIFVEVIIVIVFITTIRKHIKEKDKDKESANTSSNEIPTSSNKSSSSYCNYCGSALPEGTNKCPLCGATNKTK